MTELPCLFVNVKVHVISLLFVFDKCYLSVIII